MKNLQIWIIVTSNGERDAIAKEINQNKKIAYKTQVFSVEEVESDLKKISAAGA